MPQLAKFFVQQKLLPRVDLVKLIGKYSTIKSSGSLFKCCCPLHQEKTPSCMIYPSTQHFKCFGCGAYGDALDFIMRFKHLDFIKAVDELAHFAGVEIEYELPQNSNMQRQQQQWQQQQQRKQAYYDLMERVCNYFTAQLCANTQALNYLQQRGINAKTIETARLGYAPNDFGYLHTLCRSPLDLQLCRELGLEIMKRRTEHSFPNLSVLAKSRDTTSTDISVSSTVLAIPSVPIATAVPTYIVYPSVAAGSASTTTTNNNTITDTTSIVNAAINSDDSLSLNFTPKVKNTSYAMFRDRIMIPLRDRQGHVIAFGARRLSDSTYMDDNSGQKSAMHDSPKYINSRESALFKKHKELFGLYECLQNAPQQIPQIIVVEGYMDVLALRQAGFTNVVAALGTAFSCDHFKLLQCYTQEIVLCFDGDEAGRQATWKALQVITPELHARCTIRVAYLPLGHDPDSMVRIYGPQGFASYIQNSLSYSESIVLHEGERYGIKDPNQRIKLLSSVLSIIRAMPDALVQEVTLEMLGTYLRMDCARLYALLDLSEPQLEFCPVSGAS